MNVIAQQTIMATPVDVVKVPCETWAVLTWSIECRWQRQRQKQLGNISKQWGVNGRGKPTALDCPAAHKDIKIKAR